MFPDDLHERVLCPVSPELVAMLRRPNGMVTRGPARIWLDQDNVIHVKELTEAEQLSEMLWGAHNDGSAVAAVPRPGSEQTPEGEPQTGPDGPGDEVTHGTSMPPRSALNDGRGDG